MRAEGNQSHCITFEGMGHGFFNYGHLENQPYMQTIQASEQFLRELGFLRGEMEHE